VVLKRIDGVEAADVSYETGQGVVTYNPELTSPEAFIPELERMTGYQAEVVAE
jgi:copper chaperone CopZ